MPRGRIIPKALFAQYDDKNKCYTVSVNGIAKNEPTTTSIVQIDGSSIMTQHGSRNANKRHQLAVETALLPRRAYTERLSATMTRLRTKLLAKNPDAKLKTDNYLPSVGGGHDSIFLNKAERAELERNKENINPRMSP